MRKIILSPKRKSNPKNSKNSSLNEFYTLEQKHQAQREKIESEIFDHLKNHTKKVLKEQSKK